MSAELIADIYAETLLGSTAGTRPHRGWPRFHEVTPSSSWLPKSSSAIAPIGIVVAAPLFPFSKPASSSASRSGRSRSVSSPKCFKK